MTHLSISLFGPFEVALDDQPVTHFAYNKLRALLAYLAVEADRPHHREVLAEMLWPDRPAKESRNRLRKALADLRRAIKDAAAEPPYLHVTRESLQFNVHSNQSVDVTEFTVLLAARQLPNEKLDRFRLGRMQTAAGLYTGPFLDQFFVNDCPGFEEWVLLKREQLQQQAVDTFYRLAQYHERRGEYRPAQKYARRLVELEPWQEEAHRLLMRLHLLLDERGAALAQYESCRTLLAQELGVEPAEETVALYAQIVAGDKAALVEPLAPHNLPPQPTPFIGREQELLKIAELIANPACRLLTIAGPGGIGKSRVGLQAAGEQIGLFRDGVFFVPLADLDPEAGPATPLIVAAVAQAIDLPFASHVEPKRQLLDSLRDKEMLLVLDNFEHLAGSVGLLVEIMRRAPNVMLLVTSRERLNLQEEWLLEMEGLPYPHRNETLRLQKLETYAAVQLFVQSAQRTNLSFQLTAEDEPHVARLCQLVEGLPLGLELAAAWTRTLACREIALEAERNLSFLQTHQRNVPQRHRSLRAVFDYAWRLLSAEEQIIFQKMSIFRGGFDKAAARYVTGATLMDLSTLVDKSLLRWNPAGRYEMHSLLRQLGTEKLIESADDSFQTVQDLHAEYYTQVLPAQEANLYSPRQQEALGVIAADLENIRAAFGWAVADGKLDLINAAISGLFHYYDMGSLFQEGEEIFRRAAVRLANMRAHDDVDGQADLALGRLLARQGWFTFHLGRHTQATQLLEQGLRLLENLAAGAETVFARNRLGALLTHLGAYEEALTYLRPNLSACDESGDQLGKSITLNILSTLAYREGSYGAARYLSQAGLAIRRKLGDRWGMMFALLSLGTVVQALGDYDEAERLFQEGLAIGEALEDARGIATGLNHLGEIAAVRHHYEGARPKFEESLAIFRKMGDQSGVAAALMNLGDTAVALGNHPEAWARYTAALRAALAVQIVPSVLDTLTRIANLLLDQGEHAPAREIISLVQHHPAGSRENKDAIIKLLARLMDDGTLPPRPSHHPLEARTLDEIVAEILARTP